MADDIGPAERVVAREVANKGGTEDLDYLAIEIVKSVRPIIEAETRAADKEAARKRFVDNWLFMATGAFVD
jgi:hypothetical protein